jgi:carotenoid 1,2-hydratase
LLAYDTSPREGTPVRVARIVDARGRSEAIALEEHALPRTRWRIDRRTRSETPPRIVRSLEDTPFYARAIVDASFGGERAHAMHEVLALDRFTQPWVRFLLPFRMRRA